MLSCYWNFILLAYWIWYFLQGTVSFDISFTLNSKLLLHLGQVCKILSYAHLFCFRKGIMISTRCDTLRCGQDDRNSTFFHSFRTGERCPKRK